MHFESWQKVFANGRTRRHREGEQGKDKGWDALGRLRRWGCSWNSRQSDGSVCTPRFHKGLRVLIHVRGILSWFFTWPNSSAWCWLFACLSAIFSRAKGALTAGCTDCRVPQACSSSPHLAGEHPWRAGHGVPWLWGEMLAAFIGNPFDVCCCKAACVSTANAKASSGQQPGSVPWLVSAIRTSHQAQSDNKLFRNLSKPPPTYFVTAALP